MSECVCVCVWGKENKIRTIDLFITHVVQVVVKRSATCIVLCSNRLVRRRRRICLVLGLARLGLLLVLVHGRRLGCRSQCRCWLGHALVVDSLCLVLLFLFVALLA